MGIQALKGFVSSHNHTNVIVLTIPHRHDLSPNSCVNQEVQVFNRMTGKLKNVYQNLSVIVDADRDLYTRYGLHLNAQGKEYTANRVTAVMRDLFTVKKSLPNALKWKENGDILNYPTVKQLPCVKVVEVSECEMISQLQLYRNCDSMDQKECDVITKSSEEKHVMPVQLPQEIICTNKAREQEDLSWEINNLGRTDEDLDKQEITALPSKRIQRQPLKLSKDFLW
jgi:hypothetical protein